MFTKALTRSVPSKTRAGAVRYLNLHEYQAKDLMSSFGVTVQNGSMADSPSTAAAVADGILLRNPKADLILKAQIHAGGRGKGSFTNGFKKGVHILSSSTDVESITDKMLGNYLVTKQTAAEGQLCSKVLVNEGIDITSELYFAILMDRDHDGPVIVASTEGGMDIEAVAEQTPEKIHVEPISVMTGPTPEQLTSVSNALGLSGSLAAQSHKEMMGLYEMFISTDSTQVEINPLAIADDDKLYCVDAKVSFNPSPLGLDEDKHTILAMDLAKLL